MKEIISNEPGPRNPNPSAQSARPNITWDKGWEIARDKERDKAR